MFRHIETCLDPARHCIDTSTHCLNTSRHCLDTIMIALENDLERKKIIYILHTGLERHVSVCNKSMYFYMGGDIKMSTVLLLVETKYQ